jgi:hypothetical protein
MATPTQIFDRVFEPLAGDALNASGYKHVAVGLLHSSITTDPIYQGRVVHNYVASIGTDWQDPTKTRPYKGWRPGCTANQVPYVLLRGTNDLDTQGVNDASYHGYTTMLGTNKLLSGICCLESVEIATREYDSAQTYLSNEPLKAVRSDSASNAGTLTNQTITWGTNAIVGQVSNGETTNIYGKDVLHWLTHFVRGSEAAS